MKKSPLPIILIVCLALMLFTFFTSGGDLFKSHHTGNDFADTLSEIAPIFFIGAIGLAILSIPLFVSASKNAKKQLGENSKGPVEERYVTVLRKRVDSPYGTITNFNFVLFEDEYGSRIELAIPNSDTYNFLMIGDQGTLRHQGKRFISFVRDVSPDETEEEEETVVEEQKEQEKKYRCPKCDNIVKHGTKFCSECGAAFDWDKKQ